MTQGGEVPGAVFGADELDLGSVDFKAANDELVVEDERFHLDADAQLPGGEEGSLAELRVFGDGEIVGLEGAGGQGETEVAEGDSAGEGGGEAALDDGTQGVGVDEEANGNRGEQGERDDYSEADRPTSA